MKIIVIGGGPSGMMSAIVAKRNGNDVILLEKNEKLGKKLYITGKGRCNVTNDVSQKEFLDNVVSNPKFLMSAINTFSCADTMLYFESLGVKLKTERGGRVFPISDKSSDIINALTRELNGLGVDIRLKHNVIDIVVENAIVTKVITENEEFLCDQLIIATGGLSYSKTGSTGDGYNFATKLGHTVVEPKSALAAIELSHGLDVYFNAIPMDTLPKLEGLSLKNINAKIINRDNHKVLFEEFGEMIFTANGVSGPIILSLSSKINRLNLKNIILSIDLKPALSEETLDNRLIRDFTENANKLFRNSLTDLMPSSLIPFVAFMSRVDASTISNGLTKIQRNNFGKLLKGLSFNIAKIADIETAIVTAGGVSTKEINPKTMNSKIIDNVKFVGEVLDVDGLTGGFNIQIALSTGFMSGNL